MKTPLTYLRPYVASLKQGTALVTGVSVATSLLSISLPAQSALHHDRPTIAPITITPGMLAPTTPKTVAPVSTASTTLPNGVYLYGQSAEPDQIGKAYFVFEARQGKLVGALYMPRSSFDCTYGAVQSDKLSLTVIDTYDKTENPYAIALERTSSVASRGNPALAPVSLEGFQRMKKVSQNDQRILEICKSNYQQRVWK